MQKQDVGDFSGSLGLVSLDPVGLMVHVKSNKLNWEGRLVLEAFTISSFPLKRRTIFFIKQKHHC